MSAYLLCHIGDVDRFTVMDWRCQQIYCAILMMSTDLMCRIGDVNRFTVTDWRDVNIFTAPYW